MPATASTDRYRQWRDEIDQVDGEILALLNRRAAAAIEIGRVKRAHNEPIYVPERERAVLERLAAANAGPLSGSAVQAIFKAIIHEIRTLEEAHSTD